MWSITLKLMKKSMRMLIPAGIAILIGTAFIASTFLFGNAMDDSLRTQMTAQFGNANYVVSQDRNDSTGQSGDAPVPTIADFHLNDIRAIDGVRDVRADVSVSVQVSSDTSHYSTVAVSNSEDKQLLPVQIVQGTQPKQSGEIALPLNAAKELSAHIGDMISVAPAYTDPSSSQNFTQRVRVVGFTQDNAKAYASSDGAAIVSNDTLAGLTQAPQGFDSITTGMLYLDLDPGKASAALDSIKQLIPRSFSIYTRQVVGDMMMKSISVGNTSIVTIFLLSFGVLAMFVAALVIANTFQVLVAQRRRTLALLRTIGAKKGQLYRSVLVEAGLLGCVASALGVAFGIALMGVAGVSGLGDNMNMNIHIILSWQVFVIPIAFGIMMTVLASISSARSATSVTPLEALQPLELSSSRQAGHIRAVLSIFILLVGFAMTGFAIWQVHSAAQGNSSAVDAHYSEILLMAIAGCACIFLGLVISATFWLPVLMRGAGALVSIFGPSAKVAHANIQKNPRRIAATGVALLIGVTLVSCIATGATSAKQTMANSLDTRYSVDVIAQGNQLSQKSANDVAQLKGVEDVVYAPTAFATTVDSNGTRVEVMLIGVPDVQTLQKVVHANLQGASVNGNTALFPQYSSISGKELHFTNNQATITEEHNSDTSSNNTQASDKSADAASSTMQVTQADFRRVYDGAVTVFVNEEYLSAQHFHVTGHILLAKLDTSSSSLTNTFNSIQSVMSKDMGVAVAGPIAQRTQWESMIDSMMLLLVGLLAVAVLIALVGVANTLSLSVIERTRESATLRAIGMTKGQLKRSLAVEALLISLVSGIAGVLIGTLFGWAGSYMIFSLYGTTVFPFEWSTNAIVLVVAALAALLASVFPARRAVKTSPVEALAEA